MFVKWCHAPLTFGASRFPFPEVRRFLARAMDAFGRERILWASDFTAVEYAGEVTEKPVSAYTWAEALFYMRTNPDLSAEDLEWVLGGTARKVLGWPASNPSR